MIGKEGQETRLMGAELFFPSRLSTPRDQGCYVMTIQVTTATDARGAQLGIWSSLNLEVGSWVLGLAVSALWLLRHYFIFPGEARSIWRQHGYCTL